MKELKRALKALLLVVLAYLTQACVMGHLAVGGVMGSVLWAMLAIIVVTLGKKYAFCASCLIGMMMESMLANVTALYVIAYPVITMICAQFFADMSDRQRERRRALHGANHRQSDLPAAIRIPVCAALMELLLQIVLCAYLYLTGIDLTWGHALRVAGAVAYTTAIAILLMIPVRHFLGMRYRPKWRFWFKRGETQ